MLSRAYGPPLTSTLGIVKLGSFVTAALLRVPVVSYAADDVKLTSEFTRCRSEHELHGDLAVLRCYGAELKRQDSRLNDSYRKALNRLPDATAHELRNVQRLWVPYAAAKCGFLFDCEEFNGTSAQVDAARCAVSERARRAQELDAIAP